jgi:hypothetical protein
MAISFRGFRAIFTPLLRRLGLAGDFSRLKFTSDDVFVIAVVVHRNLKDCMTHAGIAHRTNSRIKILHLASHEILRNDDDDGEWVFIVPSIHIEDQNHIAGLCRRIFRVNGRGSVPYSFQWEPDVFFDFDTGQFLTPSTTDGLTCSSFVAAIFRSARSPLVQVDTWPQIATEEDIIARRWVLRMWRDSGWPNLIIRADEIEPSIRAARVSPGDVAGACCQRNIPATYRRCRSDGQTVISMIDAWINSRRILEQN